MALQYEKTDGHGVESLLQQGVIAAEQFRQPDHIVIAFAHFAPINGDHVVVHPVTRHEGTVVANAALGYFAFVVGKKKIHAAAMDVKLLTQVFGAHGRAFNMPARKTFAPRTCPTLNMFGWCLFPERKILRVPFFLLPVKLTGVFKKLIHHSSA